MTDSARAALSTTTTSTRPRSGSSRTARHAADRRPSAADARPTGAARLLTWGLLGPGKGIEWAIDAVAALGDIHPRPTYLIAGATHPKVPAHDGEAYRNMLIRRARRSARRRWSVRRHVPRPRRTDRLIRSADVVVLPYDSPTR